MTSNRPVIEIVDATIKHAKELSLTLREEDKQEAIAQGKDPVKAVFQSYRASYWNKTALVDGKVAAMWGISGTVLGVGQPYLITGTEVEKVSPIRFIRIYRGGMKDVLNVSSHLENYVDANYHGAIRALKLAGFTVHKPVTFGPKEALFCKFTLSV